MDTLLQVAASWILPALFFWFLFSLMAMTLIEVYQRWMKSRQKGLEEAIAKMMGPELTKEFYKHALVNPLEDAKPSYISASLFAKVVMEWMLGEKEIEKPDTKEPDEISDDNTGFMFLKIVLDWIQKKNKPSRPSGKSALEKRIQGNIKSLSQTNNEFGIALNAIVAQAAMKAENVSEFLDLIQTDLKAWFYETVNHMSAIYGNRLQVVTLGVSLFIAALANFDVINITVRLWETSKYTELLALYEKTGQTLKIDPNLYTMLPVGWYINNLPATFIELMLKIIGIFLGAFFIAIGSQYTYNLFKKQYQPSE